MERQFEDKNAEKYKEIMYSKKKKNSTWINQEITWTNLKKFHPFFKQWSTHETI